jgi:hypothetical protein
MEDLGPAGPFLHSLKAAHLLRPDLPPVIQMTLILQICQAFIASMPLYRLVAPEEALSIENSPVPGREFIVEFIVNGLIVDQRGPGAE